MDDIATRFAVSPSLIAMLSHLVDRLEEMDSPSYPTANEILRVIRSETEHELERLDHIPIKSPPILEAPVSPPQDLPF